MNLIEIAKIYTDLVKAEMEIPEEEYHAQNQINALRTKYHQILMEKMKEGGLHFLDRFDATNKAFDLIHLTLIVTYLKDNFPNEEVRFFECGCSGDHIGVVKVGKKRLHMSCEFFEDEIIKGKIIEKLEEYEIVKRLKSESSDDITLLRAGVMNFT
jgi:hypothetical protein